LRLLLLLLGKHFTPPEIQTLLDAQAPWWLLCSALPGLLLNLGLLMLLLLLLKALPRLLLLPPASRYWHLVHWTAC
jgi:hypothetical protein